MNVTTMRRLDRWLGIPTCFLLTAWRHFIDTVRRKRSEGSLSIQRVLIVKLAEQGATVLAYPALLRAVEMAGRENVFFLVFEENRFILDCLDVIPRENVVSVSSRGVVRTMASLMSSLRRVRRIGVDAVIDLEFFARSSAVLCYLSGAVVRVGLHRQDDSAPYRGDLMTHRIRYNPDLHTMQMFLLMAEAVGTSVRELRALEEDPPVADGTCPAFVASEEERAEVRRKVEKEAGTAGFSPLILLNANASDLIPLRRWPTENYVELARRLLQERYEDAKRFYLAALDLNPKLDVAYFGLANACDGLGDTKQANEYRETFAELREERLQLNRQARRGEFTDDTDLRQGLSFALLDAGKVYAAHGELSTALEHWIRAAEVAPQDVECRQMLVSVYQQMGRLDDALKYLEELSRIQPETPLHQLNLGVLYSSLGQFEAAETAFHKTQQMLPQRHEGYAGLARLYLDANKNATEARQLARKAVELAPVAANYYLLGVAQAKCDDREAALKSFKRATELDRNNPVYAEAYSALHEAQ